MKRIQFTYQEIIILKNIAPEKLGRRKTLEELFAVSIVD